MPPATPFTVIVLPDNVAVAIPVAADLTLSVPSPPYVIVIVALPPCAIVTLVGITVIVELAFIILNVISVVPI